MISVGAMGRLVRAYIQTFVMRAWGKVEFYHGTSGNMALASVSVVSI